MTANLHRSPRTTSHLYDIDFYVWTQEQARFLREKAWDRLDQNNLIEEIESLGKQQRQELRNRLGVLLGHLLKWEFQAPMRSKSWFATLREQRREIQELLEDSPSLQPYLPEALPKAYQSGLDLAVRETYLNYKDFPTICPYSLQQILDNNFFPGASLDTDSY
jgi:hypothetical protein